MENKSVKKTLEEKPCIYCGSIYVTMGMTVDDYSIIGFEYSCDKCNATSVMKKSSKDAIAAWNNGEITKPIEL